MVRMETVCLRVPGTFKNAAEHARLLHQRELSDRLPLIVQVFVTEQRYLPDLRNLTTGRNS